MFIVCIICTNSKDMFCALWIKCFHWCSSWGHMTWLCEWLVMTVVMRMSKAIIMITSRHRCNIYIQSQLARNHTVFHNRIHCVPWRCHSVELIYPRSLALCSYHWSQSRYRWFNCTNENCQMTLQSFSSALRRHCWSQSCYTWVAVQMKTVEMTFIIAACLISSLQMTPITASQ